MEIKKWVNSTIVHQILMFWIFMGSLLLTTQCKEDLSKHYIWYYNNIDSLYCGEIYIAKDSVYFNVGIKDTRATESQVDSMISLYKDDHFNDVVEDEGAGVFTNRLDSIHVVSNSDFDDIHPAGVLLNDLFYISINSYYDLLNSNYGRDRDCQLTCSTKVSNFKESDGHLIAGFVMILPKEFVPQIKEHEIAITYYFHNLRPQVLTYKVVFD